MKIFKTIVLVLMITINLQTGYPFRVFRQFCKSANQGKSGDGSLIDSKAKKQKLRYHRRTIPLCVSVYFNLLAALYHLE